MSRPQLTPGLKTRPYPLSLNAEQIASLESLKEPTDRNVSAVVIRLVEAEVKRKARRARS